MGCTSSREDVPASPVNKHEAAPTKLGLQAPKEVDEEVIDVQNMTEEQLKSLTDEEIMQIELGKLRFLRRLSKKGIDRDYIIIVDKSSSMTRSRTTNTNKVVTRWEEANEIVAYLADEVCKCDTDGITLYFFSEVNAKIKIPFLRYENVTSAKRVMDLFADPANEPHSGTDMTSVLKNALKSFINGDIRKNTGSGPGAGKPLKPLTVLFITDGAPANPKTTVQTIIDATQHMLRDDELSISFIQVGDDAHAEAFLTKMDDQLREQGAKFDVVDVLTAKTVKSMDFLSFIKKSIEN